MANDFTGLKAAIDNLGSEVGIAVSILQNPAVDNNDQAVIDELTARLTGVTASLHAAEPVAPAPAPTPVDTTGGSAEGTPADGGSTADAGSAGGTSDGSGGTVAPPAA